MITAEPPNPNRVNWIDYAKGMCIIWVVTLYGTEYVNELTHASGWMDVVVDFGRPFRMPDFFLLSGLFVSRTLKRPLRSYIDTKVLHFFYFYALWVTLKFINMEAGHLMHADWHSILLSYLRLYIEPPTGPLWFIYILALFFIAVRAVRSVPAPFVIAMAIALEVADFHTPVKIWDEFTHFFIFFYCGHIFSSYIFRLAGWAQDNPSKTWTIFSIWFVLNASLVYLELTLIPGVPLITGFAGAIAVLLLATQLAEFRRLDWLRYLGQNSIVVYLGFVIPLGLMRHFIGPSALIFDAGSIAFIVMVLSVFGSVLLYWLLRNTPLWFLYRRPEWTMISKPRKASVEPEVPVKGEASSQVKPTPPGTAATSG